MARVLVGLPALEGDLDAYRKRFDMVELRPVDGPLARPGTLRKWRKSVPPGFVFSVVLPRVVGELAPGEALDAALEVSLEAARAVEARCVILATPPGVRPTATNKKRLAAIVERLPREGVVLGWEAGGVWEVDDVIETARALRVLPVLDAAREALPPGPIAYTRLRALGKASAFGMGALERVAERLTGRREVFVVVEGRPEAVRVRAALQAELARNAPSPRPPPVVRSGLAGSLVAEDEEQ